MRNRSGLIHFPLTGSYIAFCAYCAIYLENELFTPVMSYSIMRTDLSGYFAEQFTCLKGLNLWNHESSFPGVLSRVPCAFRIFSWSIQKPEYIAVHKSNLRGEIALAHKK